MQVRTVKQSHPPPFSPFLSVPFSQRSIAIHTLLTRSGTMSREREREMAATTPSSSSQPKMPPQTQPNGTHHHQRRPHPPPPPPLQPQSQYHHHHDHHQYYPTTSSSSSASFRGCCCCLFLLFSFIALLILAVVLIIFLAVKPKKPQFDLQQVGVQYMGISTPNPTSSVDPSTTIAATSASLSLTIHLLFTAANPNKVGIKYGESKFTVMYRGIPLGKASVPGFYQGAHSVRNVEATIAVDRANLMQADAASLIKDASLNDRVELRVLGDVSAKIRVMNFDSPGVQVTPHFPLYFQLITVKNNLFIYFCGFDRPSRHCLSETHYAHPPFLLFFFLANVRIIIYYIIIIINRRGCFTFGSLLFQFYQICSSALFVSIFSTFAPFLHIVTFN